MQLVKTASYPISILVHFLKSLFVDSLSWCLCFKTMKCLDRLSDQSIVPLRDGVECDLRIYTLYSSVKNILWDFIVRMFQRGL